MAKNKDKKRPKIEVPLPKGNSVRREFDPAGSDNQTIVWIVSTFDVDGPWGLAALQDTDWRPILGHMKSFETMTWAEILKAAGGRREGNNNHPIPVEDLTPDAQKRIADIQLDDLDSVFSLRCTGTIRLYGIRDQRVCRLLWFDPWHGDNKKAVAPTKNG